MALGDVKLEWVDVVNGVPLGCVTGLLLFVLYLNDLPNRVKIQLKL